MGRTFQVREVLFEVEPVPGKVAGKDISRLVIVGVGPEIKEGLQHIEPFRLTKWTPARVGDKVLPCKKFEQGMLIGAEIEGEHKL